MTWTTKKKRGVVNDGFGAPRVIIQDELANIPLPAGAQRIVANPFDHRVPPRAVPVRAQPRQLDKLQERMEQRRREIVRELLEQAEGNRPAPAPEELDL